MKQRSFLMFLGKTHPACGPGQCCVGCCTSAAPALDWLSNVMPHVEFDLQSHRAAGPRPHAIFKIVAGTHR